MTQLLRDHLVPIIIAADTLDRLRTDAARRLLRRSAITGPAQRLLHVADADS